MIVVAAMKVRQAAALATVGWYLMLPTPYDEHSLGERGLSYRPGLALSKWTVEASIDSADECEKVKSAMIESTKKDLPKRTMRDINAASLDARTAVLNL